MAESFEWDEQKDSANRQKHGISFELAQKAFLDPRRIIMTDDNHSQGEQRYYCVGKIEQGILTVRFTLRQDVIRIFGAGYWRSGRRVYEKENKIH